MFCTNCGKELPEGVRFCTGCGRPVAEQPHSQQNTFQDAQEPVQDTLYAEEPAFTPVPKPEAPKKPKRRRAVWPWILGLVLLLLAGAVCAVLFVPALHDMVFGVEDLSFNDSKYELCLGDKLDLTDELDAGKRGNGDLKWSSDDKDVATVKNGVVTAVGEGECRITVEDRDHDDVYDEVHITVYKKVLVFSDDEIELEIDDTEDLDEDLYYEYVEPEDFKWSSSDADVAAVSDKGVVTAVGAGKAEITVEADGMSADVTIIVAEPEPDPVDVQEAVEQIRDWYYNPGSGDVRKEVASGENGWDYGREYLYHDGEMVFAYVHKSTDQTRLYFLNGKLIFVIDADRRELSGDALTPYLGMADTAKTDAEYFAP